jgi:phage terminase small subunit
VSVRGKGKGAQAPVPPADLGVAGCAVWSRAWATLPLRPGDATAVEQLARLEDQAAALRVVLARDGGLLEKPLISPKGGLLGTETVPHPAHATLRKIGQEAISLLTALGATPQARARLGLAVAEPGEPKPDAVDELKKRRAARRGEPDPGVDARWLV